ncbi:MAG: P1 family peptidase [Fimbriimonadaceae bacterium]
MLTATLLSIAISDQDPPVKKRARELGVIVGTLQPGPLNAITDVPGVMVGHFTLDIGKDVHTGATAILPHGGNVFQDKVPAAVFVGNGFGKLMGSTQVQELGEIETPIVLTNTLCVPRAADAILDYVLGLPGNEQVRSVNAVVGETNDGLLNDIRRRALTPEMVLQAITSAKSGPVQEGAVGAGRGTVCFGFKGGIGTSSRVLGQTGSGVRPGTFGPMGTIGVLVQTNYGGRLTVLGVPIQSNFGLGPEAMSSPDGSCMIVIATDLPLSSSSLERLAKRALLAVGRTGSTMSNGSGDYVIAFSTADAVRRKSSAVGWTRQVTDVPNERMSNYFSAVVDATEEAVYNSLFMAETLEGHRGKVEALDVSYVLATLRAAGRLSG